jgi:hypothetical protein
MKHYRLASFLGIAFIIATSNTYAASEAVDDKDADLVKISGLVETIKKDGDEIFDITTVDLTSVETALGSSADFENPIEKFIRSGEKWSHISLSSTMRNFDIRINHTDNDDTENLGYLHVVLIEDGVRRYHGYYKKFTIVTKDAVVSRVTIDGRDVTSGYLALAEQGVVNPTIWYEGKLYMEYVFLQQRIKRPLINNIDITSLFEEEPS